MKIANKMAQVSLQHVSLVDGIISLVHVLDCVAYDRHRHGPGTVMDLWKKTRPDISRGERKKRGVLRREGIS
jgi:hypothetical protein